MKMKNLIDKSNETKYNIFMLNRIKEDEKEIKFLLKSLTRYKAELEQIKIDSQNCTDVREMKVIEAHYDNVMNKVCQCDNRYEKLVARCERRRKILKKQKE